MTNQKIIKFVSVTSFNGTEYGNASIVNLFVSELIL